MFQYDYGDAFISYRTSLMSDRNYLRRHMHNNIEVYFLIKATGNIRTDESVYKIHNHDVIIMPKHAYHCFEMNKNDAYERIIISFPESFFAEYIDASFFSKTIVASLLTHNELMKAFDEMIYFDSILKSEEDKKAMMLLLAEKIIILLKNTTFESQTSKSVNELTSKAVNFIDDHIYENLTVSKIADALFVSKSHLQNIFLSSMKVGIKAYVIMKKMNIAHLMLQEGERSTIVASKLGYSTYSCFYKSYVKIFGVPPKDTK